ncbi:MAG TPA: DNA polymerase/3'-5' exonuclease PolX [Pseudogracilibacillus sp.]|nr:DNA polymerase/3'-5' exonuclease PolX [Pseudogracilibacillus sp.]
MNKKDVIRLLEDIALHLELKAENPFRVSAYRKAAQGLEQDVRSLKEIDDFTKIKGIGKGTKDVIVEFVETGRSTVLEELQQEVPQGLIPLLKLPGLGGKRLATVYQELGVTDRTTLKEACENGSLKTVKGLGEKSAQNILKALERESSRPERMPVNSMLQLSELVETYLDNIVEINRYNLAGSLRRLKETNKDIDFIIATENSQAVREQLIQMDIVKDIIANGDTKVSVTLNDDNEVNVDFRMVEQPAFAATLHHFTGSKDHNVQMRQLAKSRGEKINEYGVMIEETEELVQFESEKSFFAHFGLQEIPPEMREATGEVEAFRHSVPVLRPEDINGDLHMHTTWSDGAESVEEMVQYGRSLGYKYMAITDHSKFLRVANGLNESRLLKQRDEIKRVNDMYDDIHVLAGVEMDILPNGTLDFEDDFLKEMDIVIAAIHSSFQQSESQIMDRLLTAMENPYVDIIAHPTGRIIGRREGYAVHMDNLLDQAARTNTALELNANPQRFDLTTEWLQKAASKGIPIAVNTDAHNTQSLHFMNYGYRRANRAWLQKQDIINTWSKEKLLTFLNRNK